MKIRALLILLIVSTSSLSQTLLSSRPLAFKNPKTAQIVNIVNSSNNDFYVVAVEKNNVQLQKFNRALFFKDSISANLSSLDKYPILAGSSFDQSGIATIYLASSDYQKILAIRFDLPNKTATSTELQTELENQTLAFTFQHNNNFYLLAFGQGTENESQITLHQINGHEINSANIDLTTISFVNQKNKIISVKELFNTYDIEFIDHRNLVPLAIGAAKIKAFIDAGKLIITFDHQIAQTQVLIIDLITNALDQNVVMQHQLSSGAGESNSFYHSGQLYQIKLNDKQLSLSATDLETGDRTGYYTAFADDTIIFKNSPLLMQVGQKPPREFRNTKKFLQKAGKSSPAITVYKTPDHRLVTSGAIRNIASTEYVMLGILAIGTGILTGDSEIDVLERSTLQTFYFESLFSDGFTHSTVEQTPLALDSISQFLAEAGKNVLKPTVTCFENYFILGYFDKKTSSYVLRKFEDFRRY